MALGAQHVARSGSRGDGFVLNLTENPTNGFEQDSENGTHWLGAIWSSPERTRPDWTRFLPSLPSRCLDVYTSSVSVGGHQWLPGTGRFWATLGKSSA